MSTLFLTADELSQLTGRKMKSHQIEWLRRSGVPFYVNACGRPVVTRAAIDGRKEDLQVRQAWVPTVLRK